MPSWRLSTMPCCISELQQALIFAAIQADCVLSLLLFVLQYVFLTPLLLIFFSSLSRLVLLNILCWNSHSSRQKWNMGCWFHHMAPLCLINFMNIELTDVFRTKCCGSKPKMVQISSGILNMWAFKCRGFIFWSPCIKHHSVQSSQ